MLHGPQVFDSCLGIAEFDGVSGDCERHLQAIVVEFLGEVGEDGEEGYDIGPVFLHGDGIVDEENLWSIRLDGKGDVQVRYYLT